MFYRRVKGEIFWSVGGVLIRLDAGERKEVFEHRCGDLSHSADRQPGKTWRWSRSTDPISRFRASDVRTRVAWWFLGVFVK